MFSCLLINPVISSKNKGGKKKEALVSQSAVCDFFYLLNVLLGCHIDHAPEPIKGQYDVRLDEHGVYLENA